nr:hypothetical protein [Tanacetum cinerariifolium]
MKAAVEKCSVDKKYFDIQKKEIFLDNDRLLEHVIGQDVMNIVMHGDFGFANVLPADNNCIVNDNLEIECKVLLDDFEIVGNCKDKVVLDDAKDELISTKSDVFSTLVTQVFHKLKKWIKLKKRRLGYEFPVWLVKALEFMNDREEIEGGYFGDIESYLKKGKLEIVVAIITSCKPNVLGDINVTLKDPLGTTSGTIHYKVMPSEDDYAKDIKV